MAARKNCHKGSSPRSAPNGRALGYPGHRTGEDVWSRVKAWRSDESALLVLVASCLRPPQDHWQHEFAPPNVRLLGKYSRRF
ncbi:MAG: hypothetical protein M0Q47_08785 [Methanothrix sp.]|uniref:hypothetical protein n=1 Tax=Methanothrix sp. TaxID=90426 RepID=UPI0025D2D6FF|nr:hypothetical protein [Methanothrix sp.]MCK9406487.1 hypothetical protein [Methanothrix sp.]